MWTAYGGTSQTGLELGMSLRNLHLRKSSGKAVEERSEEHTSELQSPCNVVCRLLLEKKKRTHPVCLNNHPPRQNTAIYLVGHADHVRAKVAVLPSAHSAWTPIGALALICARLCLVTV